jgi:hypothetical protein
MATRRGGLAVAVLLVAGVGTAMARLPSRQPAAVIIDLRTQGGWTMGPRVRVTIGTDGSVRGSAGGGSTCARLTPAERQAFQTALALARREPWPASLAPAGDDGCCDRRKWMLSLREPYSVEPTRTFTTSWFDGNEPHLPHAFVVIKDTVIGASKRLVACAR